MGTINIQPGDLNGTLIGYFRVIFKKQPLSSEAGLKINNLAKSGGFLAKNGNFFILFLYLNRPGNAADMM